MPTIQANGCNFYYELHGQGSDLVFIHGEIHGLEYWEYQIPEFAGEHRCLAYNRRGHAKTELTSYGFSLVNQTRDLALLIDRFGIERPVIIAVAFGTTIAANYAIQYPDRVRGIVLVAWSELHDAMHYFHRWKLYNEEAAQVLASRGREAFVALLRKDAGKRIYRVIPVDSPVREKAIQMFASHPLEEYRHGMLEFGSSVPDGPGLSYARSAGARLVRQRGSIPRPAGSSRRHEKFPRGPFDCGRRPFRALGTAERIQRDRARVPATARLEHVPQRWELVLRKRTCSNKEGRAG